MEWLAAIGSICAVILYLLKIWWDHRTEQKRLDEGARKRAAAREKEDREHAAATAEELKRINESIRKQREASTGWGKEK